MCSVDADAATKILGRLRSGAFDEALKFKASETPRNQAETNNYPWSMDL